MKKIKLLSLILSAVLLLSILPVNVFAIGNGSLAELSFGTAAAAVNKGNLKLDKDFDSDVYEYNLYVPDGQTSLSVWATLNDSNSNDTIKCLYTKTNGKDGGVTVTSGKATGASLSMVLGKNYTGNTLSIVAGSLTYTVNIIRTSSLSGISVKIGDSDFPLKENFSASKSVYNIDLPYGAKPVITATATTPAESIVTVSGSDSGNEVALLWKDDLTASVEIAVYKNGSENITKNVYILNVTAPTLSKISGYGSNDAPFVIKSADDMKTLSEAVAGGQSFKNFCFKLDNDITLPSEWTPIGTSTTKYPFSGNFNGNGHLITIPKGGKAPFGATVEAYLHDFDIFGEEINGTGVVDIYTTGAAGKTAVTIENVNLKSGTKTLKSGYIGGYSHGNSPINIIDCTVEDGVIIGYSKTEKWIGSFGGELNGTVKNCISYAKVYGTDFVGGIVADKGQTMGTFVIDNCKFYGSVEATGNYAGGICGAGYAGTSWGMASAPNSPCVTITDSICEGTVKGANYVGGILGGEGSTYQCWENGIGVIKNNHFSGKVTATEKDAYIGGIVGYFAGLDKYNEIENNTFTDDCGATRGIGFVTYIDTDCADHETNSTTIYINTGDASAPLPNFKAGSGRWDPLCFTKRDHNRSDDPMGKDADKLCIMVKSDATIAQEVIAAINSIGKVSLSSKSKIDSIMELFNSLTEKQKALITNVSVLEKAVESYNTLVEAEKNTGKGNNDGETKTAQNEANTSSNVTSPKTGENTNVNQYLTLSLFFEIAALAIIIKRKGCVEK